MKMYGPDGTFNGYINGTRLPVVNVSRRMRGEVHYKHTYSAQSRESTGIVQEKRLYFREASGRLLEAILSHMYWEQETCGPSLGPVNPTCRLASHIAETPKRFRVRYTLYGY